MLTVAEAARRLRVSRATVYKLVGEGRLAHVRIGNQIRFLTGAIGIGQGPGWRGKGRPE
jgi:excisionase family DNA binding protein